MQVIMILEEYYLKYSIIMLKDQFNIYLSRILRIILGKDKHVSDYVDNIIIHTETEEEHLSAIERIIKYLCKHNINAKNSKM